MLAGIEASGVPYWTEWTAGRTDKHRPGYIDNADKLPGNRNNSNNNYGFWFFRERCENVKRLHCTLYRADQRGYRGYSKLKVFYEIHTQAQPWQ